MAQTMVSELAAELGLTLKGKTGEKHRAVLAEVLDLSHYLLFKKLKSHLDSASNTTSTPIPP